MTNVVFGDMECYYIPWKWGSGDPIFFLNESTRGVVLRVHTKNQHPRCPGSALKVFGGVCGWFGLS